MRVAGRGVAVLVVGWVLLGIHYFVFWGAVSIVMARSMDGDVEATAGTVASVFAVTAVVFELVLLARRRPGLLTRWRGPAVVAGLLVAALTGVVLFWEHVYPCSAC